MITVCKFGGTAITKFNLDKVKKIYDKIEGKKFIVVSAYGKDGLNLPKITDMLIELANSIKNKQELLASPIYKQIYAIHKNLIKEFNIEIDIDQLFKCFDKNELYYDYIVSRGEYLSGRIVAKFLDIEFFDSQDYIVFDKSGLNIKKSVKNIKLAFKNKKSGLLTGFYGKYLDKIKLFTRGGSDISGALLASGVDADIYLNYIDVNGYLQISPKIVSLSQTVPKLSYSQLLDLSQMGADVLHKDTILPLIDKNIPINIKNLYNPDNQGTLICHNPNKYGLIAITSEKAYLYTIYKKSNCKLEKLAGILNNNYIMLVDRRQKTYFSTNIDIFELLSKQFCNYKITQEIITSTQILYGDSLPCQKIVKVLQEYKKPIIYGEVEKEYCLFFTKEKIADILYKNL
ncbi:MAG: hypothetical protein RR248_04675 [Clostridia bacterium]